MDFVLQDDDFLMEVFSRPVTTQNTLYNQEISVLTSQNYSQRELATELKNYYLDPNEVELITETDSEQTHSFESAIDFSNTRVLVSLHGELNEHLCNQLDMTISEQQDQIHTITINGDKYPLLLGPEDITEKHTSWEQTILKAIARSHGSNRFSVTRVYSHIIEDTPFGQYKATVDNSNVAYIHVHRGIPTTVDIISGLQQIETRIDTLVFVSDSPRSIDLIQKLCPDHTVYHIQPNWTGETNRLMTNTQTHTYFPDTKQFIEQRVLQDSDVYVSIGFTIPEHDPINPIDTPVIDIRYNGIEWTKTNDGTINPTVHSAASRS